MAKPLTTYTVSPELLARPEMRAALRTHDFATAFKLMKKYDGASQDRIASPVDGLDQSRVSKVTTGSDRISSFDLIERIADGLRIPGPLLGLAPRPWETESSTSGRAPVPPAGPDTTTVSGERAEPEDEYGTSEDLHITIDIAPDGAASLIYRHDVTNIGTDPLSRISRELWFEYSAGKLLIEPGEDCDRNVIVQRLHDTATMSKFACQVFPAIQPGESATIAYTCEGGQFREKLYWRESIRRPTRKATIQLRHQGITRLVGCGAVEERANGSEISATDSITWRYDKPDVVIELTRADLAPNQALTLRWDVARATP